MPASATTGETGEGETLKGAPTSGGGTTYDQGLFGCFEDCSFFCTALWCPCIGSAEIARRLVNTSGLDQGKIPGLSMSPQEYCLLVTAAECLVPTPPEVMESIMHACIVTPLVKKAAGKEPNCCMDCFCAFCCTSCRITQEELELRHLAAGGREDLKVKGNPVSCCGPQAGTM